MTAKRAAPLVAILLALLGATCVFARIMFREREPMARGDTVWQLTYTATFHARKAAAKVRFSFPLDTEHVRLRDYKIVTAGVGAKRLKSAAGQERDIVVETPKTGVYQVVAQSDIRLTQRPGWRKNLPEANLTTKERHNCLRDENAIETSDPAVQGVLKRLRGTQGSKEELVERVFSYCTREIASGGAGGPQGAAAVLAKGAASPLGRARTMVALCRAAKVPARPVTGFEIRKGDDVSPHTWVEVLSDDTWESYDPENGYRREMPYYFVPVRRDGVAVIRSQEVSDLAAKYAISPLPSAAATFDLEHRRPWDVLDLTRLPVQMHDVLEVILLLPLGGLVTALVRTIIGLRTFGTFSPTLLALAFVFSHDWQTGLVLLLAVIVLGFSSRAFLERLKLLLVPRLGIILTLVVLCMVFSISVLDYFGRTPAPRPCCCPWSS